VASNNLRALGFVVQKVIDLGDGAIENGDLEAVIVHVEDKILSHDGEADEADIAGRIWHISLRKLNFSIACGRFFALP
jgi:hypothetical protein